ncbi:hypothetical protein I3842_01G098800 [Carya illinoinensis]|uniref:Uncharacterized protein n=1 Tax=Carya illinoinensis TaxID=32201 RepID=A0A922KA02_CARIL|nr:hypothetical protein I3842_01G098800 [Carya illinoinensis]
MNSANTLIHPPHSLSGFSLLRHKCRLVPLHLSCSFSSPRRRRTNRPKNPRLFSDPSTADPSPDPTLQTVIDLNLLTSHTSSLLQTSQSHLHEFLSSARDAYEDLQTLITLDYDRRLVVSCRRSTVQFVGGLVICGFVLVFSFSVLYKLGLGFLRRRSGFGNGPVVVRRDRSLGGREVVVGKRVSGESNRRVSGNPLSPALRANLGVSERVPNNRVRALEKKLPKWWPVSVSPPGFVMNKQEYQREADRLVRVIMDNRMGGKDIMEDDIVQLRQICRTSGVRVSFDTTNTRDSFYRASVDFVLNSCSRVPSHSTSVQIYDEDAPQFVAGLAENIGLESIRAARIVSAAVAARTRSRFLQAWAWQIQGKHAEEKLELSKICLILRIFPPEEYSPEMEMVARGLEKHLKVEQREYLLNMLITVCGEESRRSATEALGLMPSPEGIGDQHESNYTGKVTL